LRAPAYQKNEIVSAFERRSRFDIGLNGAAFCGILAAEDFLSTGTPMSEKPPPKSANLQTLIHRGDKVLAVLHPPTAAHARLMEKAGCEALFVGTGGVVGAYTGLADVGTATMTECVTIAGWIADSVSIPVIMDGDTGHGGIMAVRRMVRECIRAGIAGIRIDDQPI
jgi:2-methylisocitrate lyase-like PEP mutase family enzyme